MNLEAQLEAAIEQQKGRLSDIHLKLLDAKTFDRPTAQLENRMDDTLRLIRDLKKEITKLGGNNG